MNDSPYRHLPDHCFWTRGVSDDPSVLVDPVVAVPFSIAGSDKVATAGSCFAQHISRYLKTVGLNFLETEPSHPFVRSEEAFDYNYGTFTARYGNIYSARQLRQLLERAYGRFKPTEDVWEIGASFIDPFRPRIQPDGFACRQEYEADRLQHFAAVRAAFESLDVLVFTFGLTEGWESTVDGAIFPLCPGVAGGTFDPARHRLHNFSVAETVADTLAFIDALRRVNPAARIILTVSPVALLATAQPDEHVLAATTYSKSVLRVACAEVVHQRERVAYMPSYEIITGSYARGRYFAPDCRSVNEDGVAHAMKVFLRHFAGIVISRPAAIEPDRPRLAAALREAGMDAMVATQCDESILDAEAAIDAAQRPVSRCNLCGGADFGSGPNGRMTPDGIGPHCRTCGSLERSRAAAAVLLALPRDHWRNKRALLVGADQGVQQSWFGSVATAALDPENGFDPAVRDAPAGSFDLIAMIFVLEFVSNDEAAFDALARLLSPTGLMQICFMEPERRIRTAPSPGAPHKGSPRRLYGGDLASHFGCGLKGLSLLAVEAVDPHTKRRQMVHLFARDRSALAALSKTLG